jgi:hydroxymethylpyrimidine pyrophosphatase-like HAD family hydrolase
MKPRAGTPTLVTDYDRTLTDADLNAYEPALRVLKLLQERGRAKVIVATGRGMPFVNEMRESLSFAEAVVAENGAVVWLPRSGKVMVLGDGSRAKAALRASRLPFEEGEVIVSVKKGLEGKVRNVIRKARLGVELQYNQDSIMLLPRGVDKLTGVLAALKELSLEGQGLICIGDGENDLSLFGIASVRVATESAVQALKDRADVVCPGPFAVGVALYLESLL